MVVFELGRDELPDDLLSFYIIFFNIFFEIVLYDKINAL